MKYIFLFFLFVSWNLTAHAITVAATFPPIYSLVSSVMLNVDTPLLINQKAHLSHHTYELKTSEAKIIRKADIIFWVSPELETYMPKALKNIAKKGVISVPLIEKTKDLKILPSLRKNQRQDVHIWLDPNNAEKMVDEIASVLSSYDPKNKKTYLENAQNFKKIISTLKENQLSAQENTPTIISFHDGYQYLFEYMGLKGSSSLIVDEETLTGPKSMEKIKNNLIQKKPMCLIVNPNMKKKTLQLLTNNQYKVIRTEPMGWSYKNKPPHYMTLMRRTMRYIKNCLEL